MSCPMCGRIKANSPHHIIPRSEDGEDNPENIVYLCKKCHDEVEEDPRKWARFLRHYYAIGLSGRKRGIKGKMKRALVVGGVFRTPNAARPDSRRGTPNWLATQLGVRGKDIRDILRKEFPRLEGERRKRYGLLPEDVLTRLTIMVKG